MSRVEPEETNNSNTSTMNDMNKDNRNLTLIEKIYGESTGDHPPIEYVYADRGGKSSK